MFQASGKDAFWTSPWEGVSGVPIQEETPGQTKDVLERFISHLAWNMKHLVVPPEELVEVAGERNVLMYLLRLLTPGPGDGKASENETK